jgi:hypothetical protein
MRKAENRAAAKADREEKLRKWREEADAAAIAADLEQLAVLRRYLMRTKTCSHGLIIKDIGMPKESKNERVELEMKILK